MSDSTEDIARHPLLNPDALSRYLVHDQRAIVQILTRLVEKRALLALHLDRRASFITAILAVSPDERAIVLDASPDETLNELALGATELVCTTKLDRIRLQFSLSALERFPHDGYLALRTALPDAVLRLQRREFFRLTAPVSASLSCTILVDRADRARESVPIRILDISSGGLAVVVPPAGLEMSPGTTFEDCRLALPESQPIAVRIRVRNLFNIERPNGVVLRRAGCEFIGLSNPDAARIQRYIFSVERDRKARGTGLGS